MALQGCQCPYLFEKKGCIRSSQRSLFSTRRIFSEDSKRASTSELGDIYPIFGFGPLYNLHMGIFKQLMVCTLKFFGPERVTTKPIGIGDHRQLSSRTSGSILGGASSFLAANGWDAGALGLHVVFLSKDFSMRLNGLSQNSGARGMLV